MNNWFDKKVTAYFCSQLKLNSSRRDLCLAFLLNTLPHCSLLLPKLQLLLPRRHLLGDVLEAVQAQLESHKGQAHHPVAPVRDELHRGRVAAETKQGTDNGPELMLLVAERITPIIHGAVAPGAIVALPAPKSTRLLDLMDTIGAQTSCNEKKEHGAGIEEVLQVQPVARFVKPPAHKSTHNHTQNPRNRNGRSLIACTNTEKEDDGLNTLTKDGSEGKPNQTMPFPALHDILDLQLHLAAVFVHLLGHLDHGHAQHCNNHTCRKHQHALEQGFGAASEYVVLCDIENGNEDHTKHDGNSQPNASANPYIPLQLRPLGLL
mmetsp:Transcript_16598/g.25133  ORF Transcript_16598/g.25133 Transcript_16598/m.25133 type:complete len:320 (+) Transcript_16598:544-1503(+)